MSHACSVCSHDCACPVTKHIGDCVHHKHKWVALDHDIDGYGTDGNYFCFGCQRYQRDVAKQEAEQREQERQRELQAQELRERQAMGA